MKKKIIIFGSGYMAEEYLKVIKALNHEATVIGRNENKAQNLAKKYGFYGYGGSTLTLNKIDCTKIDLVIVASSIESLKEVTLECMKKNLKDILIEKPGALNLKGLEEIKENKKEENIHIAYNRRFYNSVILLKKLIKEDGGAMGCFFDFTEREIDMFDPGNSKEVIKNWGLANSSHVIDLAFFIIGKPTELNSKQNGKWEHHPSGITFIGYGKTEMCPFSYFTTWRSGGRWNIEIATKKGRYKLSPLEELQFCKKNQFGWKNIELNDKDDTDFKPGVLEMVKAILNKNDLIENLPTLEDQVEICRIINKIFGYGKT